MNAMTTPATTASIPASRTVTLTPADSAFYPTFGPAITNKAIRKACGSRMTVKDEDRWTGIVDGQGALVGLVALRGKNTKTATLTAVYGEDQDIKAEALAEAIEDARAAGFSKVEVQVRVENIAWYGEFGFKAFGPVAYGFQAVRVEF